MRIVLLALAACAAPPEHVSEWTVAAGTYTGLNWTTSAPQRVPPGGFPRPVGEDSLTVRVDDADALHLDGSGWSGAPVACSAGTVPCAEFTLSGSDLYTGTFRHLNTDESMYLTVSFSDGSFAQTFGLKQ